MALTWTSVGHGVSVLRRTGPTSVRFRPDRTRQLGALAMTTPPSRPEGPRGPMWQVIARNIRNDIAAGRLRHGQQLPSTRELAALYGVSVDPVSRAMTELANEGLVINRDRAGRIVNNPDAEASAAPTTPVVPQVLLIGGYAGSGKTELGRILARRT